MTSAPNDKGPSVSNPTKRTEDKAERKDAANVNSTASSSLQSTPLLSVLSASSPQRDAMDDTTRRRRLLRNLRNGRSVPVPTQVQQALKLLEETSESSALSMTDMNLSYHALLNDLRNSNASTSSSTSSLQLLVSTTLHLVHFLLQVHATTATEGGAKENHPPPKKTIQPEKKPADSDDSSTESESSSMAPRTTSATVSRSEQQKQEKLERMILHLVETLTAVVTATTTDAGLDATTFDAATTKLLEDCFTGLLRLHMYTTGRPVSTKAAANQAPSTDSTRTSPCLPALIVPLWKGLTGLASASNVCVSDQLLDVALDILVSDYLQTGCRSLVQSACQTLELQQQSPPKNSNSSPVLTQTKLLQQELQQEERVQYQVRLLKFLLTRTSILLQLRQENIDDEEATSWFSSSSTAVAELWSILATLRGLSLTLHIALSSSSVSGNDTGTTQPHAQFGELVQKVEKCLSLVLLVAKPNESTELPDGGEPTEPASTSSCWILDSDVLDSFLQKVRTGHRQKKKSKSKKSSGQDIEQGWSVSGLVDASRSLGCACVLLQLLRKTVVSDKSSDEWIQVLSQEDGASVQQQEDVLSIVQALIFSALPACHVSLTSDSARAETILSSCLQTLSKTLWKFELGIGMDDERRASYHERLVLWLSQVRDERPLTRELVLSLVHLHIVGLAASGTEEQENDGPVLSVWQFLVQLLLDARTRPNFRRNVASVLARVLQSPSIPQRLGLKLQQSLLRESNDVFQQILVEGSSSKSKQKKRKRGGDVPKRLHGEDLLIVGSVLSHLASAARVNDECRRLIQLGDGKSTASSGAVDASIVTSILYSDKSQHELVQQFLRLWSNSTRGRTENRRSNRLLLLGIAVLRSVRGSSYGATTTEPVTALPDNNVRGISQLLQVCTDSRVIDSATTNGASSFPLSALTFESARVLAVVGKRLSATTPPAVVEELAGCFHRLLSCDEWQVRACAMTALVQFASTVPSVHKNILPTCVPSADMQSLLQSRLQHRLVLGTTSTSSLAATRIRYGMCLSRPDKQAFSYFSNKPVFSVSSSVTFPPGSYVVFMPTQGGRMTTVVFPPGPQSLEDIHYMGQTSQNDEEGPEYHTLSRATVTTNGGCKLLLMDS